MGMLGTFSMRTIFRDHNGAMMHHLRGIAHNAFKEQIAQTLLTMKQEIIGTPSSNEAVEARIINRLEMATMDGSNAVTMARNSDQKIKLLEKKIERMKKSVDRAYDMNI